MGISSQSLYAWLREAGISQQSRSAQHEADLAKENQRLRTELRRVEDERDILKKATAYFARE